MTGLALRLSGSNAEVLARCPTERAKFVRLGYVVLITAVLAATAMSLTLRMFVGLPVAVAVVVGMAWGLAIAAIDSWLMTSLARQKHWLGTLLLALPRVAFAFLIGFVVAEPLLLFIFRAEVNDQAVREKQVQLAERMREVDAHFGRVDELQRAQATIESSRDSSTQGTVLQTSPQYMTSNAELAALRAKLAEAEQNVICEKEGHCGSGVPGAGIASQEKAQVRDELRQRVSERERELSELKSQLLVGEAAATDRKRSADDARLVDIKTELLTLLAQRTSAEREVTAANAASIGLQARMDAMDTLTSRSYAMRTRLWILRMFIFGIDALPVIAKLLMSLGKSSLYDLELARHESNVGAANKAKDDERIERRRLKSEQAGRAAESQRLIEIARNEVAREAAQLEMEQDKAALRQKIEIEMAAHEVAVEAARIKAILQYEPLRKAFDELRKRLEIQAVEHEEHLKTARVDASRETVEAEAGLDVERAAMRDRAKYQTDRETEVHEYYVDLFTAEAKRRAEILAAEYAVELAQDPESWQPGRRVRIQVPPPPGESATANGQSGTNGASSSSPS